MKTSVFVILSFCIVFAVSQRNVTSGATSNSNETTRIPTTTNNGKGKRYGNSFVPHQPSPKFDNPNFIRDRYKDEIKKPEMPETWAHRHKQPYNPNWMDYCDPYHCNDYNKRACGLNRRHLRFQWFRSACHLILNNMCKRYRGHLQYDVVEDKWCYIYVMHQLRDGCPEYCEDDINPICAVDENNKAAIFINRCALQMENCQREEDYEEVEMAICNYYLKRGAPIIPTYVKDEIE